ncbi:YciI family protein [Qaidamihabitans albus]|uniref:YciI family protein n=1 Tax=Qaidamihabitans albus TaxID=2795733 RepID=UPI0018F21BDD|nr:YciI family protein [Qaidamihabitans albus]
MRFMMIVKANADSEAGVLPSEQELAEMGRYNEELVKAGVLLDGNGLQASSNGARVQFTDKGKTTVVDGPFTETKELVAGYWIIDVKSKDEAIEWAKRVPFGPGGEIEIRKVAEAEDFGDNFTPELREAEDRLREKIAGQQS